MTTGITHRDVMRGTCPSRTQTERLAALIFGTFRPGGLAVVASALERWKAHIDVQMQSRLRSGYVRASDIVGGLQPYQDFSELFSTEPETCS